MRDCSIRERDCARMAVPASMMHVAWAMREEGEEARACWMSITKRAVRDIFGVCVYRCKLRRGWMYLEQSGESSGPY